MSVLLPTTNIPPAHIIVADASVALDTALSYMQKLFCKNNTCGVCSVCHQIREHQFYATTWLTPEKQYSLDDLEIIFIKTSYTLNEGEHHFFIIQSAELLTPACSNSLLKLVEEPPTGYHFLFLTNRLHALLPTIRSRCTLSVLESSEHQEQFFQLSLCFKELGSVSPLAFLKLLDQTTPTEQESLLIIDELLSFWTTQYKQALLNADQDTLSLAQRMISHLESSLQEPPMPGSSKLFWRNFYLKTH
jgi:hypothetical protein